MRATVPTTGPSPAFRRRTSSTLRARGKRIAAGLRGDRLPPRGQAALDSARPPAGWRSASASACPSTAGNPPAHSTWRDLLATCGSRRPSCRPRAARAPPAGRRPGGRGIGVDDMASPRRKPAPGLAIARGVGRRRGAPPLGSTCGHHGASSWPPSSQKETSPNVFATSQTGHYIPTPPPRPQPTGRCASSLNETASMTCRMLQGRTSCSRSDLQASSAAWQAAGPSRRASS